MKSLKAAALLSCVVAGLLGLAGASVKAEDAGALKNSAILDRIPDQLYHDDVHGKPAWRKHMTLRLAEEIRFELQGLARP